MSLLLSSLELVLMLGLGSVSSVKTLEDAKATPGVLYLRMPVTQFGTVSTTCSLGMSEV